MAKAAVKFLVFVFLLRDMYGELSSDLNQQLLPHVLNGQTNKIEDLVNFILFRKFHNPNAVLADYEFESNDITPKERSMLGQYHIGKYSTDTGVDDEITIKLIDEDRPNEIRRGEYTGNLIAKHYKRGNLPEKHKSEYEPFRNKTNEERDEKHSNEEQPIKNNTDRRENKLNDTMLDEVVDFLLQIVRDGIHETGRDQIVIPDVDERFSTDIVFIPVKGRFRASNGWFRNLSSIYRTGDVDVTSSKHEIIVEFDLGLKITQFGYQKYDAQLGGIEATGSLKGKISSDSITIKISMTYVNGTCKAHLVSLKVTRLDGIYVVLTGSSGFGWLLTYIANCVSGSYRNQIIHAVEQALSHTLEEKLESLSCGHLFPSIPSVELI